MGDNANKVDLQKEQHIRHWVFAAVGILYSSFSYTDGSTMLFWITILILSCFGVSLIMSVISPMLGCCDTKNRVYGKWLLRASYILMVVGLIFILIQYGMVVFKKPQK